MADRAGRVPAGGGPAGGGADVPGTLALVCAAACQVIIDADQLCIPVGIDGESVLMPTPVHCTIRPLALRVRVPRNRPGVPLPPPPMNWTRLSRQALTFTRPPATERLCLRD